MFTTTCGKVLKVRFLLLITRNRTFQLSSVELKLPTEIQFPVIGFSKRLSWRVMRGMPQGRSTDPQSYFAYGRFGGTTSEFENAKHLCR